MEWTASKFIFARDRSSSLLTNLNNIFINVAVVAVLDKVETKSNKMKIRTHTWTSRKTPLVTAWC